MLEQWQERITQAAGGGGVIQLRGGGSKAFYGQEPNGEVLDTRAHSGIVNYEPTELVITARAGTPLKELEAALTEQRQILPFEPPHFGDATVGGCISSGLSGPRRARAGSVRDFVLGAQLLDGKGKLLNLGGQVMKNVAGYDVSRLLAGSLGTLGIITEVSLKVLPAPHCEQTQVLTLAQPDAITTMRHWAGLPIPISATAWHGGELRIRLSGAASAVAAAAQQVGGSTLEESLARNYWQQLREQQLSFFAPGEVPLWRIALPATAPVMAVDGLLHEDNTLLEWNGTQRWLRTELPAVKLREMTQQAGGHATLFRGGDKAQGVFTPLQPGLMTLHQNLKREFDPAGIFNPGRQYPVI
jgi:glycolate oxidase FAD binding subunit